MLLAEDEKNTKTMKHTLQTQNDRGGKNDDSFEDEMEAMAGLDDMW